MNGSCEGMWSVKRQQGRSGVPIPFAAASARARAFACAGSPASLRLVVDDELPGVGGVEHVLGESLRQLRELGLEGLEPRAPVGRQVGAGLAELGDGLAHEPRAHRREARGRGRVRKRPEPPPEGGPERNARKERRHPRQDPVVGLAKRPASRPPTAGASPCSRRGSARRSPRRARGTCSRRSARARPPSIPRSAASARPIASSIEGSTRSGSSAVQRMWNEGSRKGLSGIAPTNRRLRQKTTAGARRARPGTDWNALFQRLSTCAEISSLPHALRVPVQADRARERVVAALRAQAVGLLDPRRRCPGAARPSA